MEEAHNTSSTLELIAGIVSHLPESGEDAAALRHRLVAADVESDSAETGVVTEIGAILMAFMAVAAVDENLVDKPQAPPGTDSDQDGGDALDDASEIRTDDPHLSAIAAEEQQAAQSPAATEPAPEPATATKPVPAPAPTATEIQPEPVVYEPVTEAIAKPEPAKWTDREKLLYRDIIHLFELGDHSGAMASLERVFMLAPDAAELGVFLTKNENTLLKLYRDHIGSMNRVTLPSRNRKTIRIPTPDPDLMLKIIRLSDGHRPIKEFIRKLEAPELHILMVISHLTRSGYLELA